MFAHIGPGNNRIKQVLVAGQISSRDYGRTNGNANLGDFDKMTSSPCGVFWPIVLVAAQALSRVVWVLLTVEVISDRGRGALSVVATSEVAVVFESKFGGESPSRLRIMRTFFCFQRTRQK